MNNFSLEMIAEHEYDYDKIMKDNPRGIFVMMVSDLSYMDGYIKSLEKGVESLKEQVVRLENKISSR